MQLVKTALAAAAGAALFCGVAFAGDDDATAKRDRVLDKVEKKLEQERKDVRDKVEKILDEELKGDKTAKGDKKEPKAEKKEASEAKPFLGVFLAEAEEGGAQVAEVMESSPAEKAGLKAGDIISKVNGADVADSKGVIAAVATHKPGESVKLDVARGEDHMTVEVKLGTRPEELAANFNAPEDGDEEKDEGADDEGKKGEKEEGKPGPGADELRARIKKFMDRMRGEKGDKGEEKSAKKGGDEDGDDEKGEEKPVKKSSKKDGKKLLDDAEKGDKKHEPKKHESKKDEDGDEDGGADDQGDKGLGDMKNFEDLAKRFMEQFMQPKDKGEGDEDSQPGADDLMGRLQDFMQSEEGQKLMEQVQPLIEKLMENGDLQKLLEQLQNGGGMQPDEGGDEEGEDLTKPEPKHETPKKGGAAYLGVSPTELTDDMREQLGIEHGVVVNDVVEDGPAANAGLKKNDVILSIDGTDVEGIEDVRTIVSKHKPGEEVEIVVLRKGKKKTLSVELGKKGAMLPSEGNERKTAMQDLQQALRLDPKIEENLQDLAGKAEERLAGRADKVKKAVQDVERAMKSMHDGGKSEDPSQDPAVRLQQMAQFAKAFAKNKPLYWDVTDETGKVMWKQRLDPEQMMKLAARLGANEMKDAAQNVEGKTVSQWECEEDCCKAKRAKGEKTVAGQVERRELPRWRQDLRKAVEKAMNRVEKSDKGEEKGADCQD